MPSINFDFKSPGFVNLSVITYLLYQHIYNDLEEILSEQDIEVDKLFVSGAALACMNESGIGELIEIYGKTSEILSSENGELGVNSNDGFIKRCSKPSSI